MTTQQPDPRTTPWATSGPGPAPQQGAAHSPGATGQGPAAQGPPAPSLGELVARISQNVTGLVKGELDLAKAKGRRMASKIGLGAGLLAVAGVLALYGLGMLLVGIAHGLSVLLPSWVAYLIVALVVFLVVAVLALVGYKKVRAGLADNPDPRGRLREDVDAVTSAVRTGLERGNAK